MSLNFVVIQSPAMALFMSSILKRAVNSFIGYPICALVIFGCMKPVIKHPLTASGNAYDITVTRITIGPDQYDTPGGFYKPGINMRFAWIKVHVHNKLQAACRFSLKKMMLVAGLKMYKPYIIDMDSPVTMRANPYPRLTADETISRRLIYHVPDSAIIQKIVYENTEINIPSNDQ
jgi:hypothetical protein